MCLSYSSGILCSVGEYKFFSFSLGIEYLYVVDRSNSAEIEAVSVEIEVVYLNLSKIKGFVVTVLPPTQPRGRRVLPAGRLRPDENPPDAAVRILSELTGIRDVFHVPLLVSMNRYPDRQFRDATLSLSFAILGPKPSDSNGLETFCAVEDSAAPLPGSVTHSETVFAARRLVPQLLETLPLALQLLEHPERTFTLKKLMAVYQQVFGEGVKIDPANFRRKVEAAADFVRPWTPEPRPPVMESVSKRRRARRRSVVPNGRPPQLYLAGEATSLDPPIRLRPAGR